MQVEIVESRLYIEPQLALLNAPIKSPGQISINFIANISRNIFSRFFCRCRRRRLRAFRFHFGFNFFGWILWLIELSVLVSAASQPINYSD